MTPTIEIDGHQWIVRAGVPCGTYQTLTSYLGRASIESTVAFLARHNLTKLKHGKFTIVPKPQIGAAHDMMQQILEDPSNEIPGILWGALSGVEIILQQTRDAVDAQIISEAKQEAA